MRKLHEIQEDMAQVILGKQAGPRLLEDIADGSLSPEARLRIHSNTFRESLANSLLGIFPLTSVFVGSDFLKQVFREYVAANPPQHPILFEYGATFPDFLENLAATKSVPYISDLARLEWLTHELMHVQEVEIPDENAALVVEAAKEGRLTKNPNTRLIASQFPLFDLWQAATGQRDPSSVDLGGKKQSILLLLLQGEIIFQMLDRACVDLLLDIEDGAYSFSSSDQNLIVELAERNAVAGS